MNPANNSVFFFLLLLSLSCSNSKDKSTTTDHSATTTTESANSSKHETEAGNRQGDGIVGEWTLILETYDDNRNRILDADERKKGFANKYYYRFNSDGSCLIHSLKLKGHYEIKTENNAKKLYTYMDEGENPGLEAQYQII